jgi:hypothetical protein
MCREAGFPNVLAHYKPVSAGMSHNGKAVPALCWDHKHGKVTRFISNITENSLEAMVEQTHREIADLVNGSSTAITTTVEEARLCACGFGQKIPDNYGTRMSYIRGHKSRQAVEKTHTIKLQKVARVERKTRNMSLVEVLENVRGLLDTQKQVIDRHLAAVATVIELVRFADESETGDQFLSKLTGAL